MFKKTLVATAIMAGMAAPAFADVDITPKTEATFTTTKVASVTKQPVLDFSTAQQDLTLTFNELNDLRDNGFIVIEIQGEGEFNPAEIRQWLSSNAVASTDLTTAVFNGINVSTVANVIGGAAAKTGAEVDKFFKTSYDGAKFVVEHTVDNNGKRLRIALKPTLDTTVTASAENTVKLNLSKANQAFKLKSGSLGGVKLTVGSLLNASYTADPVPSRDLFVLNELFKLKLTTSGKATALVSTGFKSLKGATLDGDGNVASTGFAIENLTTNQTIQLDKVTLTLNGDVSAFKKNANGELLLADGITKSGWTSAANGLSATAVAGTTNLAGAGSQALTNLGKLAVAADNAVAIPALNYSVSAQILGSSQATYNDFKDQLADLFIITRDGMKFDTITTGTTSANTIHIRDVSKVLPDEGGKIYVTITEYDAHDANGRGKGTDLVIRKPLSVTLPSGGAVTLKPADVAADVGASITAGRQARFLFEVETNQGEVAVKKSNSEGVDIQNGTRGTDSLVDFTL